MQDFGGSIFNRHFDGVKKNSAFAGSDQSNGINFNRSSNSLKSMKFGSVKDERSKSEQ